MTTTRPVQVAPPSFEALAQPVITDLKTALVGLVEDLPDPVRRAVDLERALRLNKKLAWQIFRLTRANHLAEATNVPSLTSARHLIEAARKRGVRERVLTRVRDSFERFEDFAATHGGGRAGLFSMVSSLDGGAAEQFELNVRKSLFRGTSHIWGVHSRVAARTSIYVPRAREPLKPGEARADDLAVLAGDVEMVRQREGDPLVMLRWFDTAHEMSRRAKARAAASGGPAKGPPTGVELLPKFSSNPLPRMIGRTTKSGIAETDLVFPPGRASAVTIYCSEFHERIVSPPDDTSFSSGTFMVLPTELTVREVLVPAGWSDPATARALVYARRHHPEQVYEMRTADLLPQRETLEYLGAHESPPELRDVPNHAAAVRHVLKRHGWLGMRFDVYRCRVEYPLMHSLVMARIDQSKHPPGK